MSLFDLAAQNLLSPMVLFFVLGLLAALARSDLSIPEAVAKLLALYLMMSIGFRGGAEVGHYGLSATLGATIAAGIALSFATPVLAFYILRLVSRLGTVDAAAVAAHYGSISAVTSGRGHRRPHADGRSLRGLSDRGGGGDGDAGDPLRPAAGPARRRRELERQKTSDLVREIGLNGSVVMLLGAFVIGAISGAQGMAMLKPFLVDPFAGFLCLFLLDMGLVAGRGLKPGLKHLSGGLVAFAVFMPLIGAGVAALLAMAIGLSPGGMAVFMTLAASASYIAVPAALRLALPEANPAISLTLSLGVTFPFNLVLGIPLYIAAATWLTGR